jgi:RNA polymerase sigma-70 factor (ECF subfamily)
VDISAREVGNSANVFAGRLVNKIQIGDQRAEAEFVNVYSDSLMSILLNKAQDPDIARDCYQKTLLITLRKIRAGDIRKPESIFAFLSSTAINVVITHRRYENRYTNLGDRVFQLTGEADDAATRDKDSETINLLLKKLLNQLPIPRDREILQRFYLHEEDKKSICRDFDIKSEHFDRVLYRAKQRVRLLLEAQRDIRAVLHSFLGDAQAKNKESNYGAGYIC